jgi:hypothetical protein
MSILSDLLLDLLGGGIGPSTDRGLVATFAGGCVAVSIATVWLIATSPDPIRQPDWGVTILCGSMLCGVGGLMVSLLHLRRSPSDTAFSSLCLASNLAAIGVPIVWLLTR